MPHDALIAQQNIRFQKIVAGVAVLLLIIKFTAWFVTHSLAIYTDALESVANVFSGFFGLYSLYFSAQPRDPKHPYGHGKIEFVSAAVEGVFIVFAGILIVGRLVASYGHAQEITRLDAGIALIILTAAVNYGVGYFSIRTGHKNHSLQLIAAGQHLYSDTYSTLGVIAGLVLVYLTGLQWIDRATAAIFAVIIVITGIKIIRKALEGILDAADPDLIAEIVAFINQNRRPNWIDLHNFRVIKFGRILHIDAHMSVPGSMSVQEGHAEQEVLAELIRQKYGSSVELFIHLDPTPDGVTVSPGDWTVENVMKNQRSWI